MRVYTKGGDKGETGLLNKQRVSKSEQRIVALGSIDEANAVIGRIVTALPAGNVLRLEMLSIQNQLFDCGSRLSDPRKQTPLPVVLPTAADIAAYEQSIDTMTKTMPLLSNFILPGGTPAAADCHVARAVVRRAERDVVALRATDEFVPDEIIIFLNRLSDWLFTAARYLNHLGGVPDEIWKPE